MKKDKEYILSVKAAYMAGFAHPLRLQIIELIKHGEKSVGWISRDLSVAQPTVSKHLALLRHQGIVSSRQAGTTIYYRLADRSVLKLLKIITVILKTKLERSQRVLETIERGLR